MPERNSDVKSALLDTLMSKVEQDRFPSISMLDLIEELLEPDDIQRYASLLLSKVNEVQFPSVSMLARIRDLV